MAKQPPESPALDELFTEEAALLVALRGHVPLDDAGAERRAETLIERLRQTLPNTPTAVPAAPEWLEHFRIEHELGHGGMGTVYRAFDTRLQRAVAVKTLVPALAREARYRERFLREARAAALVDHPNVVPTHYVGEANGVPFLVMPLLHGDSLHAWLCQQQEPPPLATTLHIIRQLARGLAAFHQLGMVHRDVKPSNIWLEPDADTWRVKLLDFGLARVANPEQPLTEAGAILGTPAYMAPEQARGTTVDARADIFSLGCVLYQLLTLRQAFQGPDTLATLLSLAADTPPAPHTRNPACPLALSQLCMQLLAKEPAQRPPSVPHVLERLATMDNKPTRTASRRPLYLAVALTTLALLASTYFVVTNKGTLIIETDDPNVQVTLEDAGGKITILDPKQQQAWRINTGTYQVRVGDERTIDLPNPFTLRRGDKLLATIRTVQRPPAAVPNGDRAVAERMLLLGGAVTVEQGRQAQLVNKRADLPAGELQLLEVNFFGNKDLRDRDLAALATASQLWNVNLSHTRITDAGLKQLVGLPKLHSLSLDGSLVTSAGLPQLQGCPELRALGLSFSKVDAKGLDHLQAMPELEALGLCGLGLADADLVKLQKLAKIRILDLDLCPITDDGLMHLQQLPRLQKVGLVTTSVTRDGAKRLATALPECRIILDGHIIEPTRPKDKGK